MQVIFPSDNILAALCDEQKFFKKYIENFSNIIPYCELLNDINNLLPARFIIESPIVKDSLIIKKCICKKSDVEILAGNFILGSFPKEKSELVSKLLSQKKFDSLSFKTFYTCDLKINTDKFFSWKIENIKWYKS